MTATLLSACMPVAIALALAGCAPASDPVAANAPASASGTSEPATPPAPSAGTGAQAIEATLRKGMPYADLRETLLDAGWLPVRDLQCETNVGGEARVCGVLPETESCSSDGHCVMHFAQADAAAPAQVRVDAYGPFEQWNVPGREAEFAIKSWDFTNRSTRTAAPACPSRDFDAFLQAFASQDAIRQAFTAPWVRVSELQSDDTGDHARMVLVRGDAYEDFNLVHRDGAFHFVDFQGQVDPDPLAVEVAQDGAQARLVRFQYGLSEGNSYRFEARDGCWVLVGDPEPPAP